MPLVMFKVGTLPRGASPMGSNAAAALDATHSAATWHLYGSIDVDGLPATVGPQLAGRRSSQCRRPLAALGYATVCQQLYETESSRRIREKPGVTLRADAQGGR